MLCGVSRDMTELILARGLQGAGGGGLLTLAMMSVMRAFPEAARPRLQGLLGATYGLSTMAGPLVGGFLVEHLSWRWAFFINLPLGVLALTLLALKFPHRPPTQRGRLDHLGAALLGATLVSLLLSTQREAAAAPVVPASLYAAVGLGLVVLFVWVQARVANPLLPLSLFSQRAFSAATLMSAGSGLMLFTAVVFMPQYYQLGRGLSPADSGWYLMPLMAGITVASMGCGRVLAATGRVRSTAIAACALAATAFAVLGFVVRDPGASLTIASACLVSLLAGGAAWALPARLTRPTRRTAGADSDRR